MLLLAYNITSNTTGTHRKRELIKLLYIGTHPNCLQAIIHGVHTQKPNATVWKHVRGCEVMRI